MKNRIPFCSWILFSIATLCVSGCFGPAWPPNRQISDPATVLDGLGNLITAYQSNPGEGPTTFIERIDQDGKLLWNVQLDTRQPEPQTDRDPRPSFTEMVSKGDGNVIVTWNYDNQIFAKKIDNDGHPVWKEEAIKIGILVRYHERQTLSTVNGITIVWIDTNNNLNLQMIDNDGHLLLPNSKYIENVIGFDANYDDNGNTWIVWGQSFDESVHLIKVNAQAQFEWSKAVQLSPGLPTPTKTAYLEKYSYWVIDDGSGNAIIGWANNWKGNGIDFLKVNSEGNVLWRANKANVGNSYGVEYRVVKDETGGIFVFWDDNKSTYAQHINSEGEATWGETGQVINSDNGEGMVNADSDNFGGAFILWNYLINNRGYVFYAQRIDNNGAKLWGNDPIAISAPFDSYMNAGFHVRRHNPMVVSDGINSFFISYGTLGGTFIQKIEKDGSLPWGLSGLRLGL